MGRRGHVGLYEVDLAVACDAGFDVSLSWGEMKPIPIDTNHGVFCLVSATKPGQGSIRQSHASPTPDAFRPSTTILLQR